MTNQDITRELVENYIYDGIPGFAQMNPQQQLAYAYVQAVSILHALVSESRSLNDMRRWCRSNPPLYQTNTLGIAATTDTSTVQ